MCNLLTAARARRRAQVRLCRERTTRNIFAMKKLRKDEMLRRGQVRQRKQAKVFIMRPKMACCCYVIES